MNSSTYNQRSSIWGDVLGNGGVLDSKVPQWLVNILQLCYDVNDYCSQRKNYSEANIENLIRGWEHKKFNFDRAKRRK